MSGEKLEFTKKAVNYAVNHLNANDKLSLIVYDDNVEVLLEAQAVDCKDSIKGVVNRIFPGGCTNLSGGLLAGYREVLKNVKSGQINRILLLTDGLANEGICDKNILCSKAQEMAKSGVTVTTLGVGEDFDEEMLTGLAEASSGNYYFIEGIDNIAPIFAQEMQSLLSVVAQNVNIVFHPSSFCRVSKVWGYQPYGDKDVTVNLPDMFSSDKKVIIFELMIETGEKGSADLGKLNLSYDETGEGLSLVSVEMDLSVERTDREELLGMPEAPEIMVQLELDRAAERKAEAIRRADDGDISGAVELLRQQQDAITDIMKSAPLAMVEELNLEYRNLSNSLDSMNHERYSSVTRKRMAFQSYKRRRNQK